MSRITRHFEANILSKLKAMRGFSALSKRTGLSESTLRKLAKEGVSRNPTIKVIDALDKELCDGSDFLGQGSVQSEISANTDTANNSTPAGEAA